MKFIWNLIEKICRFFYNLFCRIVRKEADEKGFNAFMQFVKFGLVGLSNTVISYLLYTGSTLLFRALDILPGIDIYVAQIIAFVLSVAWSYYWNSKKVFTLEEGQKRSPVLALLKTYVSYSFTGLFLSEILLYLWVDMLGVSEFIAPIINLIITVPVNFILNKFWAFKKKS